MIESCVNTAEKRRTRSLVVDFLKTFQELATKDRVYFKSRSKNLDSMAELGLTPMLAEQMLLELDVCDYYKGMSQEAGDPSEEVCEFGVNHLGEAVYIKLTIDKKRQKALCISFHIAEREMQHPLSEPLEEET